MTYPATTSALDPVRTSLATSLPAIPIENQSFAIGATTLYEVDADGNATTVPLGQSGPFVLTIGTEQILCSSFAEGVCEVYENEGVNGRAWNSTTIAQHNAGAVVVSVSATSVQSVATGGGGGSSSVQWVDLGLVDLVSAIMDGPTTLYEMPTGSFLSSIRFTDDPDTVVPDSIPLRPATGTIVAPKVSFGTEKSFGWYGFADILGPGPAYITTDSFSLGGSNEGHGPFAALGGDAASTDIDSLVLSAAGGGPIQANFSLSDSTASSAGQGSSVRVAAITPWAAATAYQSPASNTVATPGVLQKCAILENGTIWINDGTTGMSGGSAPDFAGNAGGSTSDGGTAASVTADAPPTLPTTIITGTNDTFMLNAETFTLAAGVLTTEADAIAAMGAALGSTSGEAFSTLVTPSDSGGSILATAVLPGPIHNGATITEGNGAAAVLGFTGNPDTFVGGTGIVWYDTTSPPPTVGQVHVVAEIVTPVSP